MNYKKGFTLVELLVVVVIIGALTAIVVSSLSSANQKGKDAGVKSNLLSARSQAEVFYNNNTVNPLTFTAVCTDGPVGGVQGIGAIVLAAAKARGFSSFVDDAAVSSTQAVCNDSASAWSASVPLLQGGFWCVDSLNTSKYFASAPLTLGTDYVCN